MREPVFIGNDKPFIAVGNFSRFLASGQKMSYFCRLKFEYGKALGEGKDY